MNKLSKTLLRTEKFSTPPIWIMRQAGRYLPEYRKLRSHAKNFLDFCYNPEAACEATLQPIRRFDFDAAIIFSDILTIPDAMGIDVQFVKNEGPKLEKISKISEIKNRDATSVAQKLAKVYEAIALTKSKLGADKDLIGFAGAPFTLACYIIEGGGSKNFEETRRAAIGDKEFFAELIEILTEFVVEHLSQQINAGATVVQLFDSWAGILPPHQLQKWVINPAQKIVAKLKEKHPQVPVIAFPRAIGINYENFVHQVKPHGIALDQNVELNFAKERLSGAVLQGNLDNFLLAFGSRNDIEKETRKILETFTGVPFVFNLGHGILPETPIENVEFLLKLVRG